jgi:hypothetical protein
MQQYLEGLQWGIGRCKTRLVLLTLARGGAYSNGVQEETHISPIMSLISCSGKSTPCPTINCISARRASDVGASGCDDVGCFAAYAESAENARCMAAALGDSVNAEARAVNYAC